MLSAADDKEVPSVAACSRLYAGPYQKSGCFGFGIYLYVVFLSFALFKYYKEPDPKNSEK